MSLAASDPRFNLLQRVRSWQKVPPLRMDLRFVRSSTPGMFRVCDPHSQKFVELYELECLVAQMMDGARSVDELATFARTYNPAIARSQIELLVVQLVELGLLEEPMKAGHGKVIPLPLPNQQPSGDEFAAFRNELVLDMHRNEALKWVEQSTPVPRAPLFEAASAPRVRVTAESDMPAGLEDNTFLEPFQKHGDDDPGDSDAFANTNVIVGSDPFRKLEQTRDRMLVTGDPDVIASSPPPEYARQQTPLPVQAPVVEQPPRTVSPRQAEAEQEDLFKQSQVAKKKWYQRRSVKALMVLTALFVISSVIDYPLYVTSECTIIPNQRAFVRSPIGGVLSEILVDEGSIVKKGDVLARLDDRQLTADRRKAVAELERIQAEVGRLRRGARKEEIQQAQALVSGRASAVAFAKKEWERAVRAVREGVGSKQNAATMQADYMVKQSAYAEAAAAFRLLQSGTRPEEISALEAGQKRAKAELEFIEQKLADMVVLRAPMDGVVLTSKFRERLHENVEAGGLVCEIADMRVVRAEIFVPEREIDTIQVGMPVVVKVESYPRHPFEGKVDFIAPAVETRDKVNVVRVVAVLDNSEGLLRRDMSGYGEIEAGDKSLFELATRRVMRWIRVRFLI